MSNFLVWKATNYWITIPFQWELEWTAKSQKLQAMKRDYTNERLIHLISFVESRYRVIKRGPTGVWTRVAEFKVLSANHYTMGPSIGFSFLDIWRIGTVCILSWISWIKGFKQYRWWWMRIEILMQDFMNSRDYPSQGNHQIWVIHWSCSI